MKKYLTFSNLLTVLGIMTFLFFLTPCFHLYQNQETTTIEYLNLFKAIFGGQVINELFPSSYPYFVCCGGLVVAFVFTILALLLNLSKNKIRSGTLLAAPFYITSGILICLGQQLVYSCNINVGISTGLSISPTAWLYVIGAFLISIGALCIIDGLATFIKPKQKEVY